MTKTDPSKGVHSSPEILRLAVMMYVRFPLSLHNVEAVLHQRGIDISHETVRYGTGGIDLARCSPQKFVVNVSSKCVYRSITDLRARGKIGSKHETTA